LNQLQWDRTLLYFRRDKKWTESVAVGSRFFLEKKEREWNEVQGQKNRKEKIFTYSP